jgi:transposase-like protein
MTPQDALSAAGRALYGQPWQSQLARDLGVADRTMRRWVAGQEPPETVWADIRALLSARREEIRETLRTIPR